MIDHRRRRAGRPARRAARRGPGRLRDGCGRRPDPGQPDRTATARRVTERDARRGRRPAAGRPPARRRPARPADRVVVLHRPPARRGRRPLRVRIRDLPGRARSASRRHGPRTSRSPTRAATASCTASGSRSARGWTARPVAADGQPTGFDFSLSGADPSNPTHRRAAGLGDVRLRRAGPPLGRLRARRGRAGRRARRARPRPAIGGHQAGRPPRRRRLDRLRAGRRLVLLLAHGDDRQRDVDRRRPCPERRRFGLVRPPVGRLHLGRWWRLGLVRGQPRRRHRPDPLARARRGWHLSAHLRDGRRRDGTVRHLRREDFAVEVTDRWTSPATGADYPAGWSITIPGEDLALTLRPTVAAQELDTRATTGVVYWEGSQVVRASRAGTPLGGEGYVELTGYAGARPLAAPAADAGDHPGQARRHRPTR